MRLGPSVILEWCQTGGQTPVSRLGQTGGQTPVSRLGLTSGLTKLFSLSPIPLPSRGQRIVAVQKEDEQRQNNADERT